MSVDRIFLVSYSSMLLDTAFLLSVLCIIAKIMNIQLVNMQHSVQIDGTSSKSCGMGKQMYVCEMYIDKSCHFSTFMLTE